MNLPDKDFSYGCQQKKHFFSVKGLWTERRYHVLGEERERSLWFHSDSQISFCSPSNNISFVIYNLHSPHKLEQKELEIKYNCPSNSINLKITIRHNKIHELNLNDD